MASGVISFNTTAATDTNSTADPVTSSSSQNDTSCQFAIAYNAVGNKVASSSPTRPTYANTACNWHMFGDEHLLENVCNINPATIGVANEDRSTSVVATRMGTAKLKGFSSNGSPSVITFNDVLLAPALPANLISISSLYSSGFRTVDPHYGRKTSNQNLYYSDDKVTIPAYKEDSDSGL